MKKLLDYIQGIRKGKDAHELERESMQDIFLKEALDGYDEVEGNHIKSIKELQNRVLAKTKKKQINYWYVAASIIVLFSLAGYFLLTTLNVNNTDNMIAYEKINVDNDKNTYHPDKEQYSKSTIADNSIDEKSESIEKDKINKREKEDRPLVINTKKIGNNVKDIQSKKQENDSFYENQLAYEDMANKLKNEKVEAMMLSANDMSKISISKKNEKIISDTNLENTAKRSEIYNKEQVVSSFTVPEKSLGRRSKNKLLQDTILTDQSLDRSIIKAEPLIGFDKYNQYIKKGMMDQIEKCDSVKGKVIIRFFVGKDGKPQNIKIEQSTCRSSNQKLVDLIINGSDWTEGEGLFEYEP